MKTDVVCKPNKLASELGIELQTYKEAVRLAFSRIKQNAVVSSWKDSFVSSLRKSTLKNFIDVPTHGCLTDNKELAIPAGASDRVLSNVWSIGGKRGWYYGNFLWKIRGYMDKAVGGIGLRRGRTHVDQLEAGDALDFWRVLLADKEDRRLLLFAENATSR